MRPVMFVSMVSLLLFPVCGAAGEGETERPGFLSLYDLAVEHDAELAAARKRRDAALEKRLQARAALLPALNLSAEQAFEQRWAEEPDSGGNMERARSRLDQRLCQLSLSQPVIHLERWYAYQEARAAASEAKLEFRQALQGFNREFMNTYLHVLRAEVQKQTVMSRLQAVKAQERQAQSRLKAGLTSRIDVQEARAEASRARVALIRARSDLEARFKELEGITGTGLDGILALGVHFDPREHELSPVNDFLEWGLEENPRLRKLKSAEKRAGYRLKTVDGTFWPDVDLSVTATRDTLDYHRAAELPPMPGSETDNLRFAFQFSMPLFSGGATVSKHREARHLLGATKERRRAALIDNRRNIEISYQNLLSLQEAMTASRLSVRTQEETLAATRRSYEAGLRDTVDVVRAQRALFDARQTYETTRLDYLTELAGLHEQAGRLTRPFLQTVNRWLEGK